MSTAGDSIEHLIAARSHDLGDLRVGRVLPAAARRMVGPFIFLDHLAPLTLPAPVPRTADVRPHPHIGLATVTYLFEGEITHRDSLGIEQVIRPGEVNWMTAGRGISHSERFDGLRATGGLLHGLQAWVALSVEHEAIEPAFEHHGRTALQAREADGVKIRLIAGAAFGLASPVRIVSPLYYAHLELQAGAKIALPADAAERAVYAVSGTINIDGVPVESRTLAVLRTGAQPSVLAREDCTVMLLGGEPVGHRYAWWNFVSSRRERIEQAKQDWSAGRIPLPPADAGEWIPLPDRA
ncbi:MAG TPA: pirin family protein [Burkholderiaceae bacterium]|nr:pirin family protein [Burkholderiaceae bacterium]